MSIPGVLMGDRVAGDECRSTIGVSGFADESSSTPPATGLGVSLSSISAV